MGSVASYVGRASTLARGGYNVRVVAEVCAGRMVVEAIGRRGTLVTFTVKRENLAPLQPGLFD
jgi:ATP-dependent RNA circularization protein (DNA/RNA ligase family)